MLCTGAIETASDEAVPKDGETSAKTDHPRFRLLATKTHQFAVSGCLRTAIVHPQDLWVYTWMSEKRSACGSSELASQYKVRG